MPNGIALAPLLAKGTGNGRVTIYRYRIPKKITRRSYQPAYFLL